MTRIVCTLLLLSLLPSSALAEAMRESIDRFAPFGTLRIYQASTQATRLVLFLSGEGGGNTAARELAQHDTMVAMIDIAHYIGRLHAGRTRCVYAAGHFEELSHYLEKKYGFPRYTLPALVGYSPAGAALVYATLAQSPPNTYASGVGVGFCPQLHLDAPFCRGSSRAPISLRDLAHGLVLQPVPTLAAPLRILGGAPAAACTSPSASFFSHVGNATVEPEAMGAHGPSLRNDRAALDAALQKLARDQQRGTTIAPVAADISDLPLIELPAAQPARMLAVIVSGDGGWASIDRQVAEELNRSGISVVGLDSLQYLWHKKDPATAGRDLSRILTHYEAAWGAKDFLLVGYSVGADTLPFMASRLPGELSVRVKAVALIGLANTVSFEFHIAQWLFDSGSLQVIPEVQKLNGMNVLCIYGNEENDSACRLLNGKNVTAIQLTGGHHFSGDYRKVARAILSHVK
jgi:type IV secretory pathway VirJ component